MVTDFETLRDSEIACAKINLALHVRRRRPDGFHDIETVFAFLDCGDILSVAEADSISLSINGLFSDGLSDSNNLVLDAAHLLADHANVAAGAHMHLEKRLPVASGIGGGSADAAATLRLLNRFWDVGLSLKALASLSEPLGADIPACVMSQTCRGEGIGQNLSPIGKVMLNGHYVLLANPLIPISTADVFRAWDGVDRGALAGEDAIEASIAGRNDLQKPAETIAPAIGDVLIRLDETTPVLARMSGSGATCFGIYETRELAIAAQAQITKELPKIWTMVGELK
ncbi:4-(cytidine 5'-diphospho)-2-C-methyl-D-erythritol kinase [Parasphingorhabdus litoris]|uniref:4-diphosphocytidyl-2-C-methyl-D-erythritol kinase n=1 Tax=Parasphingorhabdus litoris TaxID=394733 RepID=A0ABN1ARZ2_9SPHN|nr:4-(cytidine 5'-diphospho)-2-C-methyl-D-erythritol kinase [Parasphingorhabdus litoris]